jgi:hypothetical protein
MTRAHDASVLARIREVPQLVDTVFDGDVKGQPQRYVNVHSNRGIAAPDRLTGGQPTRIRKTIWVHSVGASKSQADGVAEKVIGQLRGYTLTVPGWTCEPITHEASEPVQKDDSRQPVLFYGVDQFDFYSSPATTEGA